MNRTRQASLQCETDGTFLYMGDFMSNKISLKNPRTLEEQVNILKEHGMKIEDKENAIKILSKINYYRFVSYALHKKKNDRYISGTRFIDTYRLYEFDKKLRNIIMSILETIEIAIKTNIAYNISNRHGSDAHTKNEIFKDEKLHSGFLKELDKEVYRNRKESFVKHHKDKYNGKFPIWVIIELASFGMVSRMYSNLIREEQRIISRSWADLDFKLLLGGLPNLAHVRNICAHYSKLYNRKINILPKLHKKYNKYDIDKTKIFASILVIKEFTIKNNNNEWDMFLIQLESLIEAYSDVVNLELIGFKSEWKEILYL